MQLVLDARVLSLKIKHCKQRLKNSRFIKISFEPFQDLFYDLQHGDMFLENAIFDINQPAENEEMEADILGGIFSIIGFAEEFSKNYIESNMLHGKLNVSVVGSGLQETFRTVSIDDLSLQSITSSSAAENYKFFQHLVDLQVRDIYGYKQIQLELYPYPNKSQDSPLSVGNIDILLSIISVERKLTLVEEVGVSCNILTSTTDAATSTTGNSSTDLGQHGYSGYETASFSDSSDSDNSIDQFISEFYKKYGEDEKPKQKRVPKVKNSVIPPVTTGTESKSGVCIDNGNSAVTNSESEPISTISNHGVELNRGISKYQPSVRVPISEAPTISRRSSLSKRSKLRAMPPKSSARALLSVVPAPNALKKAENRHFQPDEFYQHHHHHSVADALPQPESIVRITDKDSPVTSTTVHNRSADDDSHSKKRTDNLTYQDNEPFVNFPSRSRVRVLIKEEEEVTRIFAGTTNTTTTSDTNRIFDKKNKNSLINRSAMVVVDDADKLLPVSNPEYLSLLYEL